MLYQNLYDISLMDDAKVILNEMVTEIQESGIKAVVYLREVFKNSTTEKNDTVEKFINRIKGKMNFYGLTFSGKAVKVSGKDKRKIARAAKVNKLASIKKLYDNLTDKDKDNFISYINSQ